MFFDIDEFEGSYKISKCGDVLSSPRNGTILKDRVIKQSLGSNGYMKVVLRFKGSRYTRSVHRLLAKTFIDNPENLPCINHIDGNKLNNSLLNLEWSSYSRNAKHAHDTGLTKAAKGEAKSNLMNSDVLSIVEHKKSGLSLASISKMFGISPSTVSDIVCGRTWSHVTKIDFNPNNYRGKKSSTGIKGIRDKGNGKFDVFSSIRGKSTYLIRVRGLENAMEAKKLSDNLILDGVDLKQVVDALRKVFNP